MKARLILPPFALLAALPAAHAEQINWSYSLLFPRAAPWNNPGHWDLSRLPTSEDNVVIQNNRDATLGPDQTGYAGGFVVTNSSRLLLEGGALEVAQSAALGFQPVSGLLGIGYMDMTSGTANIGEHMVVGGEGRGLLDISGGTMTIADTLAIGSSSGSEGHVTVSGTGSLNAYPAFVGEVGKGFLNIHGGEMQVDDLSLGFASGAEGTVQVTDGTLTANIARVGRSGQGTLTIEGGAVNLSLDLFVGSNTAGMGAVEVFGGKLAVAQHARFGNAYDAMGSLNVTGGEFQVSSTLEIGNSVYNATGTALISGGQVSSSQLTVGSPGESTLTLSGGTLSTTVGRIGHNVGDHGVVTVSGGVWTANAIGLLNAIRIGVNGTGTLNLTGTGVVNANSFQEGVQLVNGMINMGTGGLTGTLNTDAILGESDTATVSFDHTNDITFSPILKNNLRVTKSGPGITILTGVNTHTGGITILGGFIEFILNQNRLGAGNITLDGGGLRWQLNSDDISGKLNPLGAAGGSFDTNGASPTFATGITGEGSLTKLGAGTLTLTGTNLYLGGTALNGGVLSVAENTNLGNAAGTLAFDGGTLRVGSGFTMNRATTLHAGGGTIEVPAAATLTQQGAISGTGSLTKLGAGTLTLTGANTSGGSTTIEKGTLALTGSGGIGSGALAVNPGGVFNLGGFTRSVGAVTLDDGAIQNGSLTGTSLQLKDGTISAALTSGGETRISGDVFLTPGGSLTGTGGDFYIGYQNTGSLIVQGNTSVTAANAYLGRFAGDSGSVALSGAFSANSLFVGFQGTGAFTLAQGSTLGVPTVTLGNSNGSNGTLNFGTGGISGTTTASTIRGQHANGGGTVHFNHSNDLTLAAALTGHLAVTKNGSGTTTLTGASDHTRGTVIQSGVLSIGNGGSTGSLAGDVTNHASLVFNRGGALTYAGQITGTGSVTKSGSGTLILTGTNAHLGGTTIQAGTLSIGDGGSLAGDIANNASLIFNRGADLTHAGQITGTGSITKSGPGTLALTGASACTGITAANGGALDITGQLATGGLGVGRANGVTAAVTVSGPGAVLRVENGSPSFITVGDNPGSTGTLTVENGGLVSLASGAKLTVGWNNATGTLLLNPGGTVETGGTDGLQKSPTATGSTVHLAGGTLKIVNSALTTSVPMVLAGNPLIDTNDLGATFSGALSGTGGLSKTGGGTLALSAANTYSGNTEILAGTLAIDEPFLADNSTVRIAAGATLHLSFGTTDTIASLVIDGVAQPSGTYGPIGSGADHETAAITGSGLLEVTTDGSYDAWAEQIADETLRGFDDDADHDGIPNGLEYILGGNPNAAGTGILPVAEITDTHLVFTFSRSDESEHDTGLTLQWSSDLAVWNDIPIGPANSTTGAVAVEIGENEADPDTITVRIPRSGATDGKLFARLSATRP